MVLEHKGCQLLTNSWFCHVAEFGDLERVQPRFVNDLYSIKDVYCHHELVQNRNDDFLRAHRLHLRDGYQITVLTTFFTHRVKDSLGLQ